MLQAQLEKYMGKFMDRIAALELCITEQDTIIKSLVAEMSVIKQDSAQRLTAIEKRLAVKDKEIDVLSEDVSQLKHQILFAARESERLAVEADDLQQYGRRMNIRVDGIPYEKGESQDDLQQKIEVMLKSVDVDVSPNMLVRFHRSAAPVMKDDGTYAGGAMHYAVCIVEAEATSARREETGEGEKTSYIYFPRSYKEEVRPFQICGQAAETREL